MSCEWKPRVMFLFCYLSSGDRWLPGEAELSSDPFLGKGFSWPKGLYFYPKLFPRRFSWNVLYVGVHMHTYIYMVSLSVPEGISQNVRMERQLFFSFYF